MTTIICDEQQYKKYLDEVDSLMDADPDTNTPEGERLSLLSLAIKEYESKRYFFEKPSPIEAIQFRMEEQNLNQNDLVKYIGSKSRVSEILAGKRSLTIPMIRTLNKFLGIPLDILIQEPKSESTPFNIEDIDYKYFPLSEMMKRNWISIKNSNIPKDIKKAFLDFFEPLGGVVPQCALWRRTINRRDEDSSNTNDLIVWTAKAMLLAQQIKVDAYDRSVITKNYLKDLAKLSQFEQGPLLAKERLARNGIKLIFLKNLSKTKVDGMCFLDKDGHPVIVLSLRYDRIDYFWFTLLHEMSHVYKHLNDKNQFIDNLEMQSSLNPQEIEADRIAKEAFIARALWKRSDAFSLRTEESIIDLAKQLNINPAIVAGRIRYETNDYTKFSNLIGQGKINLMLNEFINE
ncbi:helix-turn-helix domain-containing protein [Legionella taurinensis]|uniref:helix-turn-helix domain-containing protein n=1 Tax=Legionella taurinensis TaxID=70611 RepID=UPI000DFB874F|nr:helix-turn-helix domain-containing protein [Legionella taurinensis]RJT66992.1 helix-turn-helix domain-containing protein [Legionella taurinensis]STY26529.1 Antitoxin HigA [Legionella taurinensis]